MYNFFLQTLDLRFSIKAAFSERLQKIIGVLQISEVSWRDSGQYTCLQMSVKPDSVKLRVVESNFLVFILSLEVLK